MLMPFPNLELKVFLRLGLDYNERFPVEMRCPNKFPAEVKDINSKFKILYHFLIKSFVDDRRAGLSELSGNLHVSGREEFHHHHHHHDVQQRQVK